VSSQVLCSGRAHTSSAAPDAKQYPHAARWYRHIDSWKSEHSSLPKGTPLAAGGPSSAPAAAGGDDDDDDIDLFGEDEEEDAEAERVKAERVAQYNEAKAAKAAANAAAGKDAPVAKSVVTLQVKPWDDETDMAAMEKDVRAIEKDGLVWGASKLVPVGYGELSDF
jgi:elongation factor 1-beta